MKCLRMFLGIAFSLVIGSVAPANELADPELEQAVADRLGAWASYGRGYVLDATEVQSGRLAVRCESKGPEDGMGIAQVIRYDRPDKRPIIVGGWSKAEGVGGGGDYCLYLDIIYDDGTPWWGQTAAWTRGLTAGSTRQKCSSPRSRSARFRRLSFCDARRVGHGSTTCSFIEAASTPPRSACCLTFLATRRGCEFVLA